MQINNFKKIFYLSNSFAILTNTFHSNISRLAVWQDFAAHTKLSHDSETSEVSFRGVLITLSNIYKAKAR